MFTARYELSLKVYFKSNSLFQIMHGEAQQIIYVYKLLFYVRFFRRWWLSERVCECYVRERTKMNTHCVVMLRSGN